MDPACVRKEKPFGFTLKEQVKKHRTKMFLREQF